MSDTSFSLSFTSGGLYAREAVLYAQRLAAGASVEAVRSEIFEQNLFQVTRVTTIKRMYRELARRMTMLTPGQVELLSYGSSEEQQVMLWLAACRQYPLIAAFAHAIRERHLAYFTDMPYGEYQYLVSQLSIHHPSLDRITNSSRMEIRRVAYKMAVDAGILTRDKQIRPAFLPQRCIDIFSQSDDILLFPVRM